MDLVYGTPFGPPLLMQHLIILLCKKTSLVTASSLVEAWGRIDI